MIIWVAIDRLANVSGYSTSGLAKKAGLDATAFNRSKRMSPEGKPRWPSTESLAKILAVTNVTMNEFIAYIQVETTHISSVVQKSILSLDVHRRARKDISPMQDTRKARVELC